MSEKKRETWEWAKALIVAFGLALLIRYFLFTPIVVEGESMEPTLHNGDRLIVNRISYDISKPDRFDIVVFHATEKKDYIKRIIGLPGDKLKYENDVLYVNDEKVPEPFLTEFKKAVGKLTGDFTQKKVPEGELFVLGDNRQHSEDSRIIGTIPIENVTGEAALRFWPISDFRFFSR